MSCLIVRKKHLMMDELTPSKAYRPASNDPKQLSTLLGFLNNPAITGANLDPLEAVTSVGPAPNKDTEQETKFVPELPVASDGPEVAAPVAPPPAPKPKSAPIRPDSPPPSRIALTGRFKSGKDYVASAVRAQIIGFSEPLYFLQKYFFGSDDKDLPGAREFLQTVGMWGRGLIDANYPLTPLRAVFVSMLRAIHGRFPAELQVDWDAFGVDQDVWLRAALKRAEKSYVPGTVQAVVNVRFKNEFDYLREAEWTHFHVMCSQNTWRNRLAASGLAVNSPATTDVSEQLAAILDNYVIKQISSQPLGKKMRVIWSDNEAPPPSPRFFTVKEFQDYIHAQGQA